MEQLRVRGIIARLGRMRIIRVVTDLSLGETAFGGQPNKQEGENNYRCSEQSKMIIQ